MINGRLKAQVIKELLSYLRDPKNRFVLIGPPLMQLLILDGVPTGMAGEHMVDKLTKMSG